MIKTKASSALSGFEYSDGLLKVRYKKGVNYIYEKVTQEQFTALKRTESAGKMMAEIRKNHKCYKELI